MKLIDHLAKQKSKFLWKYDLRARESKKKILSLKNKYYGKKCIIIGNGPSLNKIDFGLLKDVFTFGQNRIYLLFKEKNFQPTFHVTVNGLVAKQFAHEINNLDVLKFMSWANRKYFRYNKEYIYLWDPSSGFEDGFSKKINERIYIDSTVTYVSMQIAYWMGFEKVGLIGVDHYFKKKGKNNELVTSNDKDEDHFNSNYFGKGITWLLPDLERSEKSYSLAKSEYEKLDRKIYDCTIEGNLDIFEKISLKDFINK